MPGLFRRMRIRRAQERFLEASRVLHRDHRYWNRANPLARKILELVSGGPLLGMTGDGGRLLEALAWLEETCRSAPLDQTALQQYHRLIFGADDATAGKYRTGSMHVTGSRVPRPSARMLAPMLLCWKKEVREEQGRLDAEKHPDPAAVMSLAVSVHQRIALIHPFEDGNGRVARLAMNQIFRRYGHGYVVLPPINESRDHFEVLEQAHQGDLEPMIALCRKHVIAV
jgi:fido (protein-threonine AMPylation protein)